MIYIGLDDYDLEIIHEVARKRQTRYAFVTSNYGTERALTKDIAGVAGEYVTAIYTGLPWTGRDDDFGADVGDLEVRTRRTESGRLCLHDKELERKQYKATQRFILARHMDDTRQVELVGWAWVSTILRHGQYVDGRTYLPNHLLHDIQTVLI
jgi:hypothetical protein